MLSSIHESSSLFNEKLTPGKTEQKSEKSASFSSMLQDAMNSVNDLQIESERLAQSLALGEIEDFHTVTIASAKADLALQLTVQVRNRVVEAYQEIIRMQV